MAEREFKLKQTTKQVQDLLNLLTDNKKIEGELLVSDGEGTIKFVSVNLNDLAAQLAPRLTPMLQETLDFATGGGITTSVTLKASSWKNKSQFVVVKQVKEDSIIVVSPAGDPSMYANLGIYCASQQKGGLTFACESYPLEDILVNILIMESEEK